jgi:hypothetical protein
MKMLLVGDSHGDLQFMDRMVLKAVDNGIDTIFQLGDFGFVWPGEEYKLELLNILAKENDVNIFFLPGNHEDWDTLDKWERSAIENNNLTFNGFIPVTSNIFYSGKTHVWTWYGKTFAVAGGAYSIDKMYRIIGESWWPQEELTDWDIASLANGARDYAPVDILLTHDGPTWGNYTRGLLDIPESHIHRQKMNMVHEATRPSMWFHGHYHQFSQYSDRETMVFGLDCNGWGTNNLILDTDTLTVTISN